ncbi:MAG: hypothetical protein K2G55_06755 [Lachnospiraceae bacterium]|nr:hypothetical protein [Lachnospiraceae bacterium]
MDFANFAGAVKNEVEKAVDSNCQIRISDVKKNNGMTLKGITIVEDNNNLSPTVYLNDYYKAYISGETTFANVINDVIGTYHKNKVKQNIDMRYLLDYEKIRQRIVYKLINAEKNKELLDDIPHIEYLDLAIVFQCLVAQEDTGIATILVHNVHQKLWGVSVEELYQAAQVNTQLHLGHEIKTMPEVLCEIMKAENTEDSDHSEYMEEFFEDVQMYVLSNKNRVEGAACMLYPGLIQEFADKTGSSLYIIPSSIHELLLIPTDNDNNYAEIKGMIKEINDTQVSTQEILSYSLYFYDRQMGDVIRL